jgi:hypothetical protein
MELVSFEEFMTRTSGGRQNQMDVAPYVGHAFDCACGSSHAFEPSSSKVLRELPKMHLVLACPQGEAITCVKVKGIFRFNGFQSVFGSPSGPASTGEQCESLPEHLERFTRDRISHADALACSLWDQLGVDREVQARHGVGVIVAAIVTSAKSWSDSGVCLGAASRFIGDADFAAFVQAPDVRSGIRRLAEDASSAARSADARRLAGLIQAFLLMPSGGPSSLSNLQAESVVSCAASICADAMAGSLLAPD